jgi:hypothetical protein
VLSEFGIRDFVEQRNYDIAYSDFPDREIPDRVGALTVDHWGSEF